MKDRHKKILHSCIVCGKERLVGLRNGKPVAVKCKSCVKLGKDNQNFNVLGADCKHWKGGRKSDLDGYVHIYKSKRSYTLEHRDIMAEHLGRELTKEEVVHHINGERDDNRIENLRLFKNDAEHLAYHRDLKTQTCAYCTEYDVDNYYCPHRGEMFEEDSCDGFRSEEELEAQKVDAAERENHRKEVEGDIE